MKIEDTTSTASFPASRIPHFEKKIGQLQRRAKKVGVAPVSYTISEPYAGKWEVVAEDSCGRPCLTQFDCQMVTVYLTCLEEIKLEGDHKLLAVLENVDEHTFITSLVKDRDFSEYRNHKFTRCDHCNIKRARKKAVIIESNGKELAIGTSCLVDYLGYDPDNALSAVRYIQDIRDFGGDDEELYGSFGSDYFGTTVERIVEATITALADNDWHYDKGDAYGLATALVARKVISTHVKFDEDHAGFRDSVLAHFATLTEKLNDNQSLGDFQYKVAVLAKIGVVENNHINIICGAIASYVKRLRNIEKEVERGESKHFGTVGDKLEVEVEITKISTFDSDYGVRMIVNGYANGKDKFTWFTAPKAAVNSGLVVKETTYEPVKGTFNIKASVKAHNNDNYGITTIINRVKKVQ